MQRKIIVNFCPTGMVTTKEMTPNVPIFENEIIEQTHQAYEIGITIAHLHARDKDGAATCDAGVYRNIFEGIRKYCPDLLLCGSSSGRLFHEFEKRSALLELKPDMCSLTLSSLNFMQHAALNEPSLIIELATKMKKYGVVPELECFDLGMINYGKFLIGKSILEGPFYWNLLFDNVAGMQSDLLTVANALINIPNDHFVSLAGLGVKQFKVNALAINYDIGVRVGLEDNIWWDANKLHKATNIQLLKRIHSLMEILQKEWMPPAELRTFGFGNKIINKCL